MFYVVVIVEFCREQQYQLTLKYVLYVRSCIAIWQHAFKLKAIYMLIFYSTHMYSYVHSSTKSIFMFKTYTSNTQTYKHTNMHAQMHHTHTHTHTHAHTHTHTHTHTQMQTRAQTHIKCSYNR